MATPERQLTRRERAIIELATGRAPRDVAPLVESTTQAVDRLARLFDWPGSLRQLKRAAADIEDGDTAYAGPLDGDAEQDTDVPDDLDTVVDQQDQAEACTTSPADTEVSALPAAIERGRELAPLVADDQPGTRVHMPVPLLRLVGGGRDITVTSALLTLTVDPAAVAEILEDGSDVVPVTWSVSGPVLTDEGRAAVSELAALLVSGR